MVIDVRPHWWYLSGPVVVLVAVIAGAVAVAVHSLAAVVNWIAVGALALAVLWLVGRYIRWASTSLVVTTSRLIRRTGVLARSGREIPLAALTDISYHQRLLQRIIGAGDLLLESAGRQGQEVFPDLPGPARIQQVIATEVDRARRQGGTGGPGAGAWSIPAQIEELDGLRQRGLHHRRRVPGQESGAARSVMTVPPRVVSLVPSITETLLAWGVTPLAVTRFCEAPGIPTVGGTKNPDVAAIVASSPDLVVMDKEENRAVDAEALEADGVAVHVTRVRGVVGRGADAGPPRRRSGIAGGRGRGDSAPRPKIRPPSAETATHASPRAWVPIWRRPWMTISGATYGSSILAAAGIDNVYEDAPDPYPHSDASKRWPPCGPTSC